MITIFIWSGVILFALFIGWLMFGEDCNIIASRNYEKMLKDWNGPTIDFDMFLNLYNIAPEKWNISCIESYPEYYDSDDRYYHYWSKEIVKFNTYKDAKRYIEWRDNRAIEHQKKAKNKTQERFLLAWQKDIDEYRKKEHNKLANQFDELYEYCEKIGSNPEVLDMIKKSKEAFEK